MIDENNSEIIEMAWCDKTSFDDIEAITGLPEKAVITIMRQNLKPSSFRLWRKRVSGRKAKHAKLQGRQTETNTAR
jgi:uncharacterized protein (TIGR03643 family)